MRWNVGGDAMMRLEAAAGSGPGGNSIHVLLMKLNTEELNSSSGSIGRQIKSGDGGNAKQCIPMQQAVVAGEEIEWQWQWLNPKEYVQADWGEFGRWQERSP